MEAKRTTKEFRRIDGGTIKRIDGGKVRRIDGGKVW